MSPETTSALEPMRLGNFRFESADQQAFARASGDANPMHVDAIAARRLISGRQVAHGVHTMLRLLESWAALGPQVTGEHPPAGLLCSFDQPISVGDDVEVGAAVDAEGRRTLTATVDGVTCTVVTLLPRLERHGDDQEPFGGVVRRLDRLQAPLDDEPGSQAGQCMTMVPPQAPWATMFPAATRWMGPSAVSGLACLSYFVGMVCPGMHSVFSSLKLRFAGTHDAGLPMTFRLKRFDPRFKLFIVEYQGPLLGELRAFLRPPPQPQPSTSDLIKQVRPGEFLDTRSLVVGGSRGLGEVTAKLLAAGGGQVLVTYAQGRDDAMRVAADIHAAGVGACEVMAMDLTTSPFASLEVPHSLKAVYYFATPRIYRKKRVAFDPALHAEFCAFYLERFAELCLWLETRAGEQTVTVYLPSTVFIEERPKGMTEYAMAKAASEVLADDLNRVLRRVKVVHTRLPRLATDQTTSILGLATASNVEVLLNVVRTVDGHDGH